MSWKRLGVLGIGVTFAVAMGVSAGSAAAFAAPTAHASRAAAQNHPTFVIDHARSMRNGLPLAKVTSPTGLPPSAIQSVYNLSGLSPTSNAGAGQIIAIVDAYNDVNALSDLNVFNAEYGYPALSTCTSLTQAGSCFEVAEPSGAPAKNADWNIEESLDIEWAHAEAPGRQDRPGRGQDFEQREPVRRGRLRQHHLERD